MALTPEPPLERHSSHCLLGEGAGTDLSGRRGGISLTIRHHLPVTRRGVGGILWDSGLLPGVVFAL